MNSIFFKDHDKLIPVKEIAGVNIRFFGQNNTVILESRTGILQGVEIFLGNRTFVEIKSSKFHIKNLRIAGRKSNNARVTKGEDFSCVGCDINLNDSAEVTIGNDCMFSFDISFGHRMVMPS